MKELSELQDWYATHCNGEWEHQYGVVIESLDNPGWWVKIDLQKTELENVMFSALCEGDKDELNPKATWLRCAIKDGRFEGAGDSTRLQQILRVFLDWARDNSEHHPADL